MFTDKGILEFPWQGHGVGGQQAAGWHDLVITALSSSMALLGLGRAAGRSDWRLLHCDYVPDLGARGGKGGPHWSQPVAGKLLVLDSKSLVWEEVFFPVQATFGNRAGTSPVSFPKCPACRCVLGTALWPDRGNPAQCL